MYEGKPKHIEVFPGSISDLERMTGKSYKPIIKNDGVLLKADAFSPKRSPTLMDMIEGLRESARKDPRVDALVHVLYLQTSSGVYARGYGVQEDNSTGVVELHELEKEQLSPDEVQAMSMLTTKRFGPKRSRYWLDDIGTIQLYKMEK